MSYGPWDQLMLEHKLRRARFNGLFDDIEFNGRFDSIDWKSFTAQVHALNREREAGAKRERERRARVAKDAEY